MQSDGVSRWNKSRDFVKIKYIGGTKMTKKALSYGVVGLLAVALLAGYTLLNPIQVLAGPGSPGGRGAGRGAAVEWDGNEPEMLNQNAYGRSEAAQGRGASGGGAFDGGGRISGAGQGRNETVRIVEWETLTGKVSVVDDEITIQTAEGQVLIGMGQSAYREGFALAVGDEITVLGFHEDGEFKAGTVENLTTGETITLRDETGRPMWAGQGRLKNQVRNPELVEE
jgi:hypothetical protein